MLNSVGYVFSFLQVDPNFYPLIQIGKFRLCSTDCGTVPGGCGWRWRSGCSPPAPQFNPPPKTVRMRSPAPRPLARCRIETEPPTPPVRPPVAECWACKAARIQTAKMVTTGCGFCNRMAGCAAFRLIPKAVPCVIKPVIEPVIEPVIKPKRAIARSRTRSMGMI